MATIAGTRTGRESWSDLDGLRPALEKFLSKRCKDGHEVEDIVQETLLRAARYRGGLMRADRLRPWAMRIAANIFRDRRRCDRRLPAVELDEDLIEAIEERELDPSRRYDCDWFEIDGEPLDREHALSLLGESFLRLTPLDQDILRSYYGGAGSCAETAREVGLVPSLAKVRLFRARRRLEVRVRRRLAGLRSESPVCFP